jgi:hypothetical protein
MTSWLPELFKYLTIFSGLGAGICILMMRNYVARFKDDVPFTGIYIFPLIGDYVHLSKTKDNKLGVWLIGFLLLFACFMLGGIAQFILAGF